MRCRRAPSSSSRCSWCLAWTAIIRCAVHSIVLIEWPGHLHLCGVHALCFVSSRQCVVYAFSVSATV
eukprot:506330-Pelagomonas_calceolata.AAC.1